MTRINCTIDHSISDWDLGSEVNGTYDNMIGEMQKGVNKDIKKSAE